MNSSPSSKELLSELAMTASNLTNLKFADTLRATLGHSVLLVAPDDIGSAGLTAKVRSIEPFTWAWLGLKLAEGIIAYIGGRIFQQAFFPDVSNNEVVESLSAKIEEAVRRIQRYIDARLEWHIVDEAQRRLTSGYRLLREYTNAPEGDKTRLSRVNETATELWDLLYARGQAAFIPACLAISLKVAALWTVYSESKNPGDRQNVIEFLDLAISAIDKWRIQIFENNRVFELTTWNETCECTPVDHHEIPGGPGRDHESRDQDRRGHDSRREDCACTARFRANGRDYHWVSPSHNNRDAARAWISRNAYPEYSRWVQQRDVIYPFVWENLLWPAQVMLRAWQDARKAIQ